MDLITSGCKPISTNSFIINYISNYIETQISLDLELFSTISCVIKFNENGKMLGVI